MICYLCKKYWYWFIDFFTYFTFERDLWSKFIQVWKKKRNTATTLCEYRHIVTENLLVVPINMRYSMLHIPINIVTNIITYLYEHQVKSLWKRIQMLFYDSLPVLEKCCNQGQHFELLHGDDTIMYITWTWVGLEVIWGSGVECCYS